MFFHLSVQRRERTSLSAGGQRRMLPSRSGRGRAHARRPPTTPDVRVTYPAFPGAAAEGATVSFVSFIVSPVSRQTPSSAPEEVLLPPMRSSARSSPKLRSSSTEITCDSTLPKLGPSQHRSRAATTASADCCTLIPTPLDAGSQWRTHSSPRVICATFMLCPSDLRGGVPCKYRASHLWACLPTLPRLYPFPVRRTNILPAASFRSRIAPDTLAVQLPLPLAGCGGDFHPQVTAPPPRGYG